MDRPHFCLKDYPTVRKLGIRERSMYTIITIRQFVESKQFLTDDAKTGTCMMSRSRVGANCARRKLYR
jgi:hypothetical protein